jgi:hypothetical protein
MMTATQLSRNYPSTWKKTFPFLNRLVRKCNLQKETFDDGIQSKSDPKRRALINETGFYLYKEMNEKRYSKLNKFTEDEIEVICNNALNYIRNLDFNPEELFPLGEFELNEAKEIASNLYHYFFYYEKGKEVHLSPKFNGCGFVSDCYGDVLAGDTLYEIKSGERDFRISDLKQVLVYLTLNYSLHERSISYLGLINPRLGNYVVVSVHDAIELASGQSTADCFNELINFFDSPDDFR